MAQEFIPDEERSLSRLFFILSVIVVVASLWAVVDEILVRRPWKRFQTKFYALEYEKLSAAVAAKEREIGPAVRTLQEKLQATEARLARDERYQQSLRERARVKDRLADVSQEQQFAKSRQDAEYYLYEKAKHEGDPDTASTYKAEVDRLQRRIDDLDPEIAKLKASREVEEKKIQVLQAPLRELEEERRKLVAEVKRLRDRMHQIVKPVPGFEEPPAFLRKFLTKPPEVHQVVIEGMNRTNFREPLQRVERCQTCHMGIDRPGFEGETIPVEFRTHPHREVLLAQHPVEKFGCTVCHGGQGVALTVETAHGELHIFDQTPRLAEPLLTKTWIQSQCRKCHQPELPLLQFASTIARGKEVFESMGCPGCHLARGFENLEKVAPDLRQIASKIDSAWLVEWIKEPQAYLPRTKMPNFRFTAAEAEAAAAYLLASSQPYNGPRYPGNGNPAAGQKLVEEIGCLGCHTIGGKGNAFAPDLSHVASKVNADWLYAWVKDPQDYASTTKMPNLRLSEEQAAHITAYLMTLGEKKAVPGLAAKLGDGKLIEEGKQLIGRYGCYGCHEIKGMEERVRIGAELSTFADKRPWEMAFGDVPLVKKKRHDTTRIERLTALYKDGRKIEESWEGWAFGKLKDARMFATDRILQQMPDFAFGDEEAAALLVFLRSFTDESVPQAYVSIPSDERALRVAGQQLFVKYNCLGCHHVAGQGGTLAPNLAYEGSKVHGDWLLGFLKEPHMLRPLMQARMPTFPLANHEATTLRGYILTAFVDARVPKAPPMPHAFTAEMAGQGEKLYWEKYPCFTCHQIQGKAGGAPVGPDLTHAWKRLNSDWMMQWIRNPQAFEPATIMPNLGLSEEEATAIVAYLESLTGHIAAEMGTGTGGSVPGGKQPSQTRQQ